MTRPWPLSILLCQRLVPARAGSRSSVEIVLDELGCRTTVVADGPADLPSHDLVLLCGTPGYYPRLRRQLKAMPKATRPLVAALHSEPLPPPRASGLPRWSSLSAVEIAKILLWDWRATDIYTNAFKLRRMMREGTIDLLFPMSAEKLVYLREQGYPGWHVPYGYHPSMGRPLGLERDVDVLFLGDTRPPRRRRLLAYLASQGVAVSVRGSWHDPALWGERRTRFLNRTRILVHLQRYPGKLAAKRFILAMANGVLVISEPVYEPAPFVDGEHFVMTPVEQMSEKIRYYLHHPDERERITRAAHRLVTGELTLQRSLQGMLDVIASRLPSRPAHAAGTTPGPSQSVRAVSSR